MRSSQSTGRTGDSGARMRREGQPAASKQRQSTALAPPSSFASHLGASGLLVRMRNWLAKPLGVAFPGLKREDEEKEHKKY